MADMYDTEDAPAMDEKPQSEQREGDENEKPSEGKTALINSSICEGKEPGDVFKVRVVETHDGEYSVAYEEDDEEKKPDPGSGPKMAEAPGPGGMGGDMYS